MYSNILVPLDGSDLAESAMPHAKRLAQSENGTLHLVNVFTRHPDGGVSVGGLRREVATVQTLELLRQLEEATIGQMQEYLDRVSSQAASDGIAVKTQLLEGSPHESLIRYCEQNGVDLVVMSTHGRGGLRRMLIGSVTDKMIRAGRIPVLVVPG